VYKYSSLLQCQPQAVTSLSLTTIMSGHSSRSSRAVEISAERTATHHSCGHIAWNTVYCRCNPRHATIEVSQWSGSNCGYCIRVDVLEVRRRAHQNMRQALDDRMASLGSERGTVELRRNLRNEILALIREETRLVNEIRVLRRAANQST
jgi:hypothetical protein